MALTNNQHVLKWIEEMTAMLRPSNVVWVDGSEEQLEEIRQEGFKTGELIKLNDELLPGCVYHRSALNDVARVESRTYIFVAEKKKMQVLPTTGWLPMRCILCWKVFMMVAWKVVPCTSFLTP